MNETTLKRLVVVILLAFSYSLVWMSSNVKQAISGPAVNTWWTSNCATGTPMTCALIGKPMNMIQNWTIGGTDITDHTVTGDDLNLASPPSGANGYGYTALVRTAVNNLCVGANGASTACTTTYAPNAGDIYASGDLFLGDDAQFGDKGTFYGRLRTNKGATIYGQLYAGGVTTATITSTTTTFTTAATATNSTYHQGGIASGASSPKLKWKMYKGYINGNSPQNVAISEYATVVSFTCMLYASSGQMWFPSSGDTAVTDPAVSGVVNMSSLQKTGAGTGNIVLNYDEPTFTGAAGDAYKCLVWYQ